MRANYPSSIHQLRLTGKLLRGRHLCQLNYEWRHVNQTQFDLLLLLVESTLLDKGEGVTLSDLFPTRDDLLGSRKYIQRLRRELNSYDLVVSAGNRRYRLDLQPQAIVIEDAFWRLSPASVPIELRFRLQQAYMSRRVEF